jgi:predicted kinase
MVVDSGAYTEDALAMNIRETETTRDVAVLKESLGTLAEASVKPSFVLVSGLPGTGKSVFAKRLAEDIPLTVLETDVLRRRLFSPPTYSPGENSRLFQAIHELLADLLGNGTSVALDATNLVERHRETLYAIADATNALLIIVKTEAPSGTVEERLAQRSLGANPGDNSEADIGVYQRMRPTQQRIGRNHLRVDTTGDISGVVRKIAKDIARWNRA